MNPYGKYDAKQLAEGLAEIKLKEIDKPGFAYSNLGMGLLGDALAHKAGMSYGELVRTRIFEPLKLKDTTVSPTKAQLERMATGHSSKGKPLPRWTFETLHGCGAVCSTPNDMLTLHEAFCGRTETKLRKAMQGHAREAVSGVSRKQCRLELVRQDIGGSRCAGTMAAQPASRCAIHSATIPPSPSWCCATPARTPMTTGETSTGWETPSFGS